MGVLMPGLVVLFGRIVMLLRGIVMPTRTQVLEQRCGPNSGGPVAL